MALGGGGVVSGGCVLLVRVARPADRAARLDLLRAALAETTGDAFIYFFFQELTLQAVVLCGAVLFIFCAVSVSGCLLLLPAAAGCCYLAVTLHAHTALNNQLIAMDLEEAGWVVEACGAVGAGAGGDAGAVTVRDERDLTPDEWEHTRRQYKQVVGTVSLYRDRSDPWGWWVGGLCVGRAWRRRGAGGALLRAVTSHEGGRGGVTRTALSHLQPAARALLHKHGWEVRGAYHRPLLGDALTLPMVQLARPPPPAPTAPRALPVTGHRGAVAHHGHL